MRLSFCRLVYTLKTHLISVIHVLCRRTKYYAARFFVVVVAVTNPAQTNYYLIQHDGHSRPMKIVLTSSVLVHKKSACASIDLMLSKNKQFRKDYILCTKQEWPVILQIG